MSPAQEAVLVVLGVIAWIGLGLCVAIAIGLSIRTADRRESAVTAPAEPAGPDDAAALPQVPQPRGSRLDVRL